MQSVEWNDETAEEQVAAESPIAPAADVLGENLEGKEDEVVNNIEENEWDKLLRVRLVFLFHLGFIHGDNQLGSSLI